MERTSRLSVLRCITEICEYEKCRNQIFSKFEQTNVYHRDIGKNVQFRFSLSKYFGKMFKMKVLKIFCKIL